MAEIFTGSPGKYVDLEKTISGFKGILDGKYDDLPEMAFYMVRRCLWVLVPGCCSGGG